MHEMSLAESALEIIENTAIRHGGTKVRTVWLEIGQLAGVEVEAMKFCFDAVTRGSIADGARLEIIETPGEGHCPVCGKTIGINERYGLCPECAMPLEVVSGMQMRVRELEME